MESAGLDPAHWVKNYSDYLYSLALMKLGSKETAEDIVQDALLSAFKARESFKGNSSEKTWLTTILNNKITDYYRKKDVLKEVSTYISDTEASFDEHFFNVSTGHWLDTAGPADWKDQADSNLNRNELNRIIQYCIEKMPPKLVPVFIAKFLDETETENICKDFNITASNYWVIIHRAKVLIRSCLEKNWLLN